MADPVSVDCPKNKWTKVATSKTGGTFHKKTEAPQEYLQTYKATGTAAPADTEAVMTEFGVPMFKENGVTEGFLNSALVDVYIWCVGADGRVRADL